MKSRVILTIAIVSFLVSVMSFGSFFLLRSQGFILGSSQIKGTVYFDASKKPVVNQTYPVTIRANTGNININAVGLYLRFDPEKIKVAEIDTLNSFCQFYPEKKFDNNIGLISLACGSPHPGVKGELELVKINFLPLMSGNSNLQIDPKSSLLSSDGKGTNILTEYPAWEVSAGESF